MATEAPSVQAPVRMPSPLVSTFQTTVSRGLNDFDAHAMALMTFETSVVAFSKGSGVPLDLRSLCMIGTELSAIIAVPSPPLVEATDGTVKVHVSIETDKIWSVTVETDTDEALSLSAMLHVQYAHALVKMCVQAFIDSAVAMDWCS